MLIALVFHQYRPGLFSECKMLRVSLEAYIFHKEKPYNHFFLFKNNHFDNLAMAVITVQLAAKASFV